MLLTRRESKEKQERLLTSELKMQEENSKRLGMKPPEFTIEH